jgi:hypothetical protein
LDQNVGLNVRIRVVALQTSPYIARLYANDRILSGGIVRLAPEQLYPNEPFFKQIAVATDLLIDNVLEELLAAPAGSEMPTDYNPPQFFSNEIGCNRVFLQVWDRLIASIIEYDFFEHAEIIRCDRYRAKRNSANRNKGLERLLR